MARSRRAEPAFDKYLSGPALAETKRPIIAETIANAPSVKAAARAALQVNAAAGVFFTELING
jgi:hypothetical protein